MGRERRKWEHTLPRFPFHCYTNPTTTDGMIRGLWAAVGVYCTLYRVRGTLPAATHCEKLSRVG